MMQLCNTENSAPGPRQSRRCADLIDEETYEPGAL
jgi:hypothetical protein